MSPEIWSVMTMGIVILIAIATSNRSLRRELGERIDGVRRELNERIDGVQRELSERIDGVQRELSERINGVQRDMSERIDGVQRELSERIDALSERIADVRERLGRVEGLLEGLQWTRRKRAGKERGDEKHSRALS